MPAPRLLLLAIGLLSAAALGYEILLMRLLSIIQWHHFAYMIISLALLGYGFSGTLISLLQSRLQRRFHVVFIGAFVLFSLSSIGSFALAQQLPFHAEALLWDPRQAAYLAGLFLLLSLPFFFAASAFCLAFMHFSQAIARIYAFDLIGAGLGGLLIIVLLFRLMPLETLIGVALLGLVGALIALWASPVRQRSLVTLALLLLAGGLSWAHSKMELKLSQFKPLSQTLQIQGTHNIAQRSSPLGWISVLESKQIPFRHAPGLSLNADTEPPPQLGLFIDGASMSAVTHWEQQRDSLRYLDQMSSALAYHLSPASRVLVLGAGPGNDVLQAWFHEAGHVDAVELNPQIIELVEGRFGQFSGQLYSQDFVDVHIEDIRRFLARPRPGYDIIQLALIDGFNASASGLYALNESYIYTREALRNYIEHLAPSGYVSITRWVKLPPRDAPKLFATAVDVLRGLGIEDPGRHLLLIRSWQTSTLLIKRTPLNATDIKKAKAFAQARSFDVAYYPGMDRDEANQYNILKEPYFYQATQALLSGARARFMENYKFNLRPATDDRPFFHQFFKWSSLGEILSLRGEGGLPLLEWGYLTLIVTLCIALLVSAPLVLLPLARLPREPSQARIAKPRLLGYFLFIGLGFLFIEIAFIQKFMLLLHHPIYAISVVLTGFLIFSGLGAYAVGYLSHRLGPRRSLRLAVSLIALFSVINLLAAETLFAVMLSLPIGLKVMLTLAMIAPLAFAMGMPFPLALDEVSRHTPHYIPWAWGINGFASVISAVLATVLAIHWGFSVVVLVALGLYLSLLWLFPSPTATRQGVAVAG